MSPFVTSKNRKEKLPRSTGTYKIIGVDCPEMAVVDRTAGKYKFLNCVFVEKEESVQGAKDGKYIRVTVSGGMNESIDLNAPEWAILKKLDALCKEKAKPKVSIEYYSVDKVGKNKDGGKEIYTNHKANVTDVAKWRVN